jgi:hypothetical protein
MIQADPTNEETLLIGDASSQPWKMAPGENMSLVVDSTGDVYFKRSGTPNATVNWLVMN